MSHTDEIVKDFLLESYENLDQLDRDFVSLEANPTAKDRIASIFRVIHTIKGTTGFLGFSKLGALTHAGENLLAKLRNGELILTPEITSALLSMVDKVRVILNNIESTGQEGDRAFEEMSEYLNALADTAEIPAQKSEPKTLSAMMPQTVMKTGPFLVPPPITPPSSEPAKAVESKPTEAHKGTLESSVRVDVSLLDKLMNLVGELVLARNQLLLLRERPDSQAFVNTSHVINLITTELQESVMKTRMQPISSHWSRLPRVVRDLSVTCGKQVQLELSGGETELDRSILEAIKDPLTHVIRNAIDHGIETPTIRAAKGKPLTGTLSLRAFHEGGHINIEISDDGAGIDARSTAKKAIERGFVSSEQVSKMSEREALQLIFLPGFSTAQQVTNISGRGVGMDVVKTNIEKIGGTIDLHSSVNVGTTLKLKIPLTLAIIPALLVTSGESHYAIPQLSLLELVRLEGEQAHQSIETLYGAHVYRLRGTLLPLVHLDQILGGGPPKPTEITNIIVLQADERQFGLVVKELSDTEEIVVKPLGKELRGLSVFAGATILGDGKVALILDVLGLAESSGVFEGLRNLTQNKGSAESLRAANTERLLLFGLSAERTLALPLSMVARLEEFPISKLERSGRQQVIQYRDTILPLIDLRILLEEQAPPLGEIVPVIVYQEQGQSVGFIVERILDTVEVALEIKGRPSQPGILGAAVIQERITDLLDVRGILQATTLKREERSVA